MHYPYESTAAFIRRRYAVTLPTRPYFLCFDCGAPFNGTGLDTPWQTAPDVDGEGADLRIAFYPPRDRAGYATVEALFWLTHHRGALKASCALCTDRKLERLGPVAGAYNEADLGLRAEKRALAFMDASEPTSTEEVRDVA